MSSSPESPGSEPSEPSGPGSSGPGSSSGPGAGPGPNRPDLDQLHPILVGFGAQSCAQYLENYDRHRNGFSLAYYCWFQGFLSAVNLHRMSVGIPMIAYEATNLQMVEDEAFLRFFCQEHPDQRFVQAALALIARRDAEREDTGRGDDGPAPRPD